MIRQGKDEEDYANLVTSSEKGDDYAIDEEGVQEEEEEEEREDGEEMTFFMEEKEDWDEDYEAELSQKQVELQEEFRSVKNLVNLTGLYEPRPSEKVLMRLNLFVAKICK